MWYNVSSGDAVGKLHNKCLWVGVRGMRMRWLVRGVVQGVGFRMWAAREARSLGLAGWVRNLADGSVEAEAEGEQTGISALEARLRRGPPHSVVREFRRIAPGDDMLPLRFEVRRE